MENKSKNEFISAKIVKLMGEGKTQKQALGEAYGIWNEKHKEFGGSYQAGDWYENNNPYFTQNPGVRPNSNLAPPPPKDLNAPNNTAYNGFQATMPQGVNINDTSEVNTSVNPEGMPQNNPELKSRMAENKYYNTMNGNYDDSGNAIDTSGKHGYGQNTPTNFEFFNPYATPSVETAAYTLGQGIENGNTLETAGSGLKLLTGLGRNAFAGAGQARRRNYVMQDYQNRAREASVPANQYIGKEGGYYFQDGGGMPPQQDQGQNMAQQVAQALQGGADPQQVLQQLVQSGIPQDQATQLITSMLQQLQGAPQEEQSEGANNNLQEEALESHQMGGVQLGTTAPPQPNNKDLHKVLTGEYTAENENNEPKIAEIERGEYLQTPDGNITKALGENHEQGGVKLTEQQIPQGSRIISNHLTLDNLHKDLSKNLNLKLDKNDTFSKVLDKWGTKNGLNKINDEQETIIKDLEKQTKKLIENPNSEKTISLNINLLQKRIKELDDKKAPLEEERKSIFDVVFNAQESTKEEQAEGTNNNPQEEALEAHQMGGTQIYNGDMIQGFANKHNIPYERAQAIIQEFKMGGYYEDGGGDPTNPLIVNSTLNNNFTQEPSDLTRLPQTPMSVNPNPIFQGTPNSTDPSTGTGNYYDVWKPLVEQSMANPVEAKKIDDWLTTNSGTYSPNIQKQLEGLKGVERYARIQKLATDTKPGLFHNAVLDALKATKPQEAPQTEEAVKNNDINFNLANPVTEYGLMDLPDQSTMTPSSLQPALKIERRYDRIEAPQQSPDAIIQELRRQEATAIDNVKNLPDAQRASAIAQIQANTQAEINKNMNAVEGQNIDTKFKTDANNQQVQMAEENARANDLQSYENKIMKADSVTNQDIRNWVNHNTAVNVANSNKIENTNVLNQAFPNYKLTNQGVTNTVGDNIPNFNSMTDAEQKQALADAWAKQKEAERKAKLKARKSRF